MSVKAGLAALVLVGTMAGVYVAGGAAQDAQSVGIQAARAALRDPSSGETHQVQKHTSRDGRTHAICGEIRGRNLFGMMADYQGFVAIVQQDERRLRAVGVAFQDPIEPRAYEEAHRKYCYAGFFY